MERSGCGCLKKCPPPCRQIWISGGENGGWIKKRNCNSAEKRITIYHGIGDYMASDSTCVNFRYQYEYEKFIGILLFMPIITAVLAHW